MELRGAADVRAGTLRMWIYSRSVSAADKALPKVSYQSAAISRKPVEQLAGYRG